MIIDTQSRLTCTEPCLSAGVRLPSVAPGLGTSGHAATPPLAFVCGCVWKWVRVCVKQSQYFVGCIYFQNQNQNVVHMSNDFVSMFQSINQSVNQQSKPTFM